MSVFTLAFMSIHVSIDAAKHMCVNTFVHIEKYLRIHIVIFTEIRSEATLSCSPPQIPSVCCSSKAQTGSATKGSRCSKFSPARTATSIQSQYKVNIKHREITKEVILTTKEKLEINVQICATPP